MKWLAIGTGIFLLVVLLAGIWLHKWFYPKIDKVDFSNAQSGEFGTADSSGKWKQRALSPEELITISQWLEEHRSGWGAVLYTPPSPTKNISLVYPDGGLELHVRYQADSRQGAITAYGLMKSGAPMDQGFSDKDFAMILKLMSE